MTDREKLLEILNKPIFPHEMVDPLEAVADYLLDNGVTFATDNNVGSKWIPVSERLPEENVRVLICYIDGGGSRGINTDTRHWNRWLCFSGELATVTHWMPLPEPPKEEGHE